MSALLEGIWFEVLPGPEKYRAEMTVSVTHLPLACCCCVGCWRPAGSETGMTSGLARCSKDEVFKRCLAVHESSAGTGAPPGGIAFTGCDACKVANGCHDQTEHGNFL